MNVLERNALAIEALTLAIEQMQITMNFIHQTNAKVDEMPLIVKKDQYQRAIEAFAKAGSVG